VDIGRCEESIAVESCVVKSECLLEGIGGEKVDPSEKNRNGSEENVVDIHRLRVKQIRHTK
jgi:hypothetical protein